MGNLKRTENNFSHEIFGNLTTITNDENEVYFISNEVADILGYARNKNMLDRLRDKHKLLLSHSEAKGVFPALDIHSSGIQLLTEQGLYKAVLGSAKEEAEKFEDWITGEVLPTIRKTGSYGAANLSRLDILRIAIAAEEKLLLQAPIVAYAEKVLDSSNGITTTTIASELGMSAVRLNKLLHSLGVQYKKSGMWNLYEKYKGNNYTVTRTYLVERSEGLSTQHSMLWTEAGRRFVHDITGLGVKELA